MDSNKSRSDTTIPMYLTPRCASAWIAPITLVRYFGNHIEPATLLGLLQSTGPTIITDDRSAQVQDSEWQQSGTMRFGLASAGSAVVLPPQS